MKALLLIAMLPLLGHAVQAQSQVERLVAGRDYTLLEPRQPTAVKPGEVEIIEAFSFVCGGCYLLDPKLREWLKAQPSYVRLKRMQVIWDDRTRALARLQYALESLGRSDLEPQVFEFLFENAGKNRNALTDANEASTFEKQRAFVSQHGVDSAAFAKVFHSQDTSEALNALEATQLKYRIEGTPTLIINGKYVVTLEAIPKESRLKRDITPMLDIAAGLVEKEHRLMQSINQAANR